MVKDLSQNVRELTTDLRQTQSENRRLLQTISELKQHNFPSPTADLISFIEIPTPHTHDISSHLTQPHSPPNHPNTISPSNISPNQQSHSSPHRPSYTPPVPLDVPTSASTVTSTPIPSYTQ